MLGDNEKKLVISALIDGDHMANCAKKLLMSINKVDSAGCKLDTLIGKGEEYSQQLMVVDEYNAERNEYWSALKSAIYEYEKRADRVRVTLSPNPSITGERLK
jgi:hypothetical protein